MNRHTQLGTDERAVSSAVTHVLTIGITTVLVAMLLISGSSVLEAETDRSVESSLETIGERLAGEIDNVDRIAANGADTVTVTADHPHTVSSTGYTVDVLAADVCADEAPLLDGSTQCLRLTASEVDVVVYVPVTSEAGLDTESSVSGGTIEIVYDGDEIRLEGGT